MRLILLNEKRLTKLVLPEKIEGSFWLIDELNSNDNIINVESNNGSWVMKSSDDVKIIDNNSYVKNALLVPGKFYVLEYNGKKYFLYCENVYDSSVKYYKIDPNTIITFGNDKKCDILYQNTFISNDYLSLSLTDKGWEIKINPTSVVYINDSLLQVVNKKLHFGDTLFILGIRITLYNGVFSINNLSNLVSVNTNKFPEYVFKGSDTKETIIDSEQIRELDLYQDDDYFFKNPRIRRFIENYELKVSPPPSPKEKQNIPLILTLGPTLTMAIISVVTLSTAIMRIVNGKSTWVDAIPSLITSVVTLITSLLWPNLMKHYQKKQDKKNEEERRTKYREYIESKKKEIYDVSVNQLQILKENLITTDECEEIILKRKRSLWERRNDQKDFLTVRVGIGDVPLDLSVNFGEEDAFVMKEDFLKKEMEKVIEDTKKLKNAPVGYSFYNKRVTAVMGKNAELQSFMDNILIQLLSFHSFDDLKLVFLVSKKNLDIWNKYKELPHCFSNNKQIRFFADEMEDIKYISSYLEREFYVRMASAVTPDEEVENESEEKTFNPYYLIITDNYVSIRNVGIITDILKSKENTGFGIICVENRLGKLPSECVNFISLEGSAAILSTEVDNYNQQNFNKEINYAVDVERCCEILSNIPIEFSEDLRNLPTTLGFLEMYNIGKVEQLNALNRWRLNNPIKTLRALIGVNDEGSPIYLDLHEKFHGPHGLIAGTTGAGKSELIITYILSMVVNYSPNEVAFILIDYKGGGLAGAFENKTQGIKLPHLAGTITNLDKASLNRTLVSIESELKRRQKKFNEVRDKLGESTIDIYKYQKFFREGKIDEPLPHLFIISDEFAELKAQQPEFMDDLISTARIGRSLGVHLILATQKPSGVVNDQIWSNTKFRICLKVQNTADSNEMLKKPDAASITNAGRFFLQVGNDEIFVLGQSGWAGTQYIPNDSVKKKYDRSISFIDNVGNVVRSIEETKVVKLKGDGSDELSNIMKYICTLAAKEGLKTNNLWLDAIPENIYVDDLIKKYNYTKNNVVTAVVGEYDAPSEQYQNILTLALNETGNTIVYGMSGANREMFVSSVIYSVCTNYTAEDINIYIVDFGSETLRVFEQFPQVGDIVYSNEREKLLKLISIVSEDIKMRKKLFANYNGDYNLYIKNSGTKIPIKLIVINNYDSFKESYATLEDTLTRLTREGERYGILFLISANNSHSIFRKIERNFHNLFALDMTEKFDYMDILGKIGNVYPASLEGRGLFKSDAVYEFQTAQITDPDNLIEFVKGKIEIVKSISSVRAEAIPVLPDVVTLDMLEKGITNINAIPIGIGRESLEPFSYNFFESKATVISSKDIINCIELLKTIIYGIRKLNQMVVLIDTEQQLTEIGGMVNTYADKNFEDFILRFEQFLDEQVEGKNVRVLCIIAGLERLQGSVNDKKFNGFFRGVKAVPNLNLIFVDSSFKLKKVGFEPWYSSIINNSSGIWVGPGFLEQNVINCNDYGNRFKENIDKNYAWVARHGDAELIKLVEERDIINEE